MKGYRLWDSIACKFIVNRDVSFNKPGLLKEGENAQAPWIDNVESAPNAIEGEIGHDSFHDVEGEAPIKEVIPEIQELGEQVCVGEPRQIPTL